MVTLASFQWAATPTDKNHLSSWAWSQAVVPYALWHRWFSWPLAANAWCFHVVVFSYIRGCDNHAAGSTSWQCFRYYVTSADPKKLGYLIIFVLRAGTLPTSTYLKYIFLAMERGTGSLQTTKWQTVVHIFDFKAVRTLDGLTDQGEDCHKIRKQWTYHHRAAGFECFIENMFKAKRNQAQNRNVGQHAIGPNVVSKEKYFNLIVESSTNFLFSDCTCYVVPPSQISNQSLVDNYDSLQCFY